MTVQTRRQMLASSARVASLLAAAGFLPGIAHAAWPKAAFDAKSLADAVKGNPKKPPQFRLHSATRVHEGGIASNRRTAGCGEYVPGPCTHRPSRHGSWFYPKTVR